MSDPHQEERERVQSVQRVGLLPTQVAERIRLGLSPVDDDLPFAQAVRQKEQCDQASKAFGKRQKRRDESA